MVPCCNLADAGCVYALAGEQQLGRSLGAFMRLLLAFSLLALSFGAPAQSCEVRADRSVEGSVDGVKRLIVRAGAGELVVEGIAGRRSVSASGVACGRNDRQVERLQLRIGREGDALILTTQIPEGGFNPFNWFAGDGWIDLTVNVPAGMPIDIEDSSGSADISKVGSTRITDSSGELNIDTIRGDLIVGDGSGDIVIRNVHGMVRLADASGEVAIAEVTGDVIVTNDGSGDIQISDVRGSVTIGDDASGSIRIERVGGSVKIENDASGDIYVAQVKNDFTVLSDSSGDIEATDIEGNFTVGTPGSGSIKHERIGGEVRLPSSHSITPQEPDVESSDEASTSQEDSASGDETPQPTEDQAVER